jgi:hypothetical protein
MSLPNIKDTLSTLLERFDSFKILTGIKTDGTPKALNCTDDGALYTTAVIGDVVIEAPGVNSKYNTIEGSIADGITDQPVVFSSVTTGYQLLVTNDSNTPMTFKINSTGNDAGTIGPGETFTTDLFKFTSLYISNSSGTAVDYRIRVEGN